jgi:hypothetical protein
MLMAVAEYVQFPPHQPRERSVSPLRDDPPPTDTPNPNQFVDGDAWGEHMIQNRKEPMECIIGKGSFDSGVRTAEDRDGQQEGQTMTMRRSDEVEGGIIRGHGRSAGGCCNVS